MKEQRYIAKVSDSGKFQVWRKDFKNCPWVDGKTKNEVKRNLKRWGIPLNDVENSNLIS